MIRAQVAARAIFAAGDLDKAIAALDHQINAEMQTTLRMAVRTLVERGVALFAARHMKKHVSMPNSVPKKSESKLKTEKSTTLPGGWFCQNVRW